MSKERDHFGITVEGKPEVVAAINKVARTDWADAGNQAARGLLPHVVANTRYDTGTLAGGWNVDGIAFINEVYYAPWQEYGTKFIEPTNAIGLAVDEHEDIIIGVFEKEAQDAINQAGLGDQ